VRAWVRRRGRGFTGKIDDALVRSPAGGVPPLPRARAPLSMLRGFSSLLRVFASSRLLGLEVRAARVLSTFTEWPKNVRKRKISKVERGLRGRGAGRGLRSFFLVGMVGKRRNSFSANRAVSLFTMDLHRRDSYAEAGDGFNSEWRISNGEVEAGAYIRLKTPPRYANNRHFRGESVFPGCKCHFQRLRHLTKWRASRRGTRFGSELL
jgi:hypothetical protein